MSSILMFKKCHCYGFNAILTVTLSLFLYDGVSYHRGTSLFLEQFFFFFTCHHMVTKLVNGGNCVYKHWTESPLKTHWSQRCRGIIQSSIRNPFKIRLLAVSVFISKTFGNQDSREMLNLKNWLYLSLFQLKGWVVVVEEPTFGTGKGLFNFIL